MLLERKQLVLRAVATSGQRIIISLRTFVAWQHGNLVIGIASVVIVNTYFYNSRNRQP